MKMTSALVLLLLPALITAELHLRSSSNSVSRNHAHEGWINTNENVWLLQCAKTAGNEMAQIHTLISEYGLSLSVIFRQTQ